MSVRWLEAPHIGSESGEIRKQFGAQGIHFLLNFIFVKPSLTISETPPATRLRYYSPFILELKLQLETFDFHLSFLFML